jgi:hypothetical protein
MDLTDKSKEFTLGALTYNQEYVGMIKQFNELLEKAYKYQKEAFDLMDEFNKMRYKDFEDVIDLEKGEWRE